MRQVDRRVAPVAAPAGQGCGIAASRKIVMPSKKAGDHPALIATRLGSWMLSSIVVRAGLLQPRGRRIPSNRAAIMKNGGIRNRRNRCQTEGEKRGTNEVFHRNSPSPVGREVRL